MTNTVISSNIGALFTDDQIRLAQSIGADHNRLRDEVVKPAMAKINKVTGQENDPDYMAYMLECAIGVRT